MPGGPIPLGCRRVPDEGYVRLMGLLWSFPDGRAGLTSVRAIGGEYSTSVSHVVKGLVSQLGRVHPHPNPLPSEGEGVGPRPRPAPRFLAEPRNDSVQGCCWELAECDGLAVRGPPPLDPSSASGQASTWLRAGGMARPRFLAGHWNDRGKGGGCGRRGDAS